MLKAEYHTMKNILVVFTGGTIGSQAVDGAIDTSKTAGSKLLQLFFAQVDASPAISFKVLQPLQILSENLHPQDWQQMIAAIEAEDLGQFDGIILTHGTDTLAYSAAALGLYFNALKIPLFLVSSDLPLDQPDANGVANFSAAVAFILRIGWGGVFVSYKNTGQSLQIYRATRLASCLQLSADFIGVQSRSLMRFADGNFNIQQESDGAPCQPISLQADFSARILLIRPYPGLDYTQFNLDKVCAVLHDLYHSGTACSAPSAGDQHSLADFIENCRQRGIPVYLAPALKTEQSYSSTRALLAKGGVMIWNTPLETAYVKLLLAYGNFQDESAIAEFLERNIAWEQV